MEKRKFLKVIFWNFLSLLLFSSLAFGDTITVAIPDTTGSPGEYVKIPIYVDYIPPESAVYSAQFSISFDPNLLEVNKDSVFFEGTLIPQNWQKWSFSPNSSTLNIALAGAQTISGSGALAYIGFKVLSSASPGDSSIIHFSDMKFNEWKPPELRDGVLRVVPTSVYEDDNLNLPSGFSLGQNYPNPFNPTTTIPFRVRSLEFGVGRPNPTSLVIYNILGQKIRCLLDENLNPGLYQVTWEGKNDGGEKVPSGVYFYQLRSGNISKTRKMVLLR